MQVKELVKGKYYVYSQRLGKEIDGTFKTWLEPHKVKFLGDLNQDHPELGITHCSHFLFIGSQMHEDESVGVCANAFLLPDYEILEHVEEIREFT